MPDKKIVFTAPATYKTLSETVHYQVGDVVSLREDMATRWISRGLATDEDGAIERAEAAKAPPVPEPEPEAPRRPLGRRGTPSISGE